MSFLSSQHLEVIRRVTSLLSPSKNMQFCNEQIRTQPLFSPPCASATYGSARMCRRKNKLMIQLNKIWIIREPCHNSIDAYHIATTFFTCHDGSAVMPCAKFRCCHFITTRLRAKWIFHWISIVSFHTDFSLSGEQLKHHKLALEL